MMSSERSKGLGIGVPKSVPPPRPPAAKPEIVGPFARGTEQSSLVLETDAVVAELAELEQKLLRCIAALTMHFQPIVRATDRGKFACEALLRSADKSLPHPGAILDAAERLEKITTLGRAVRAQCAKVIAGAPDAGLVFINLHLLDLFDKQLTSPFSPLAKVA